MKRDNHLYPKPNNRYLSRVNQVTLIIGMYYAQGNGAVIVSDSRMVRGPDYTTERKLFEITSDSALATSGLSGVSFELLENVRLKAKTSTCDIITLKRIIENEALELCYRYKLSETPTFRREEILFDGIVGGFHEAKPRLYHLAEPGYMEILNHSHSVGDGSRHATQIIETLFRPDISKDRAIEIAVHALIQTSRLDTVVDSNPQIAVFEEEKCEILNYSECDDNGVNKAFLFDKPEISAIKNKINGIAEKQTKIFDLMLDGSDDLKKRLIDLLGEYDRTRKK
jgi:20S proteasome alpha/beta subunit